jgi:hypothetical protein
MKRKNLMEQHLANHQKGGVSCYSNNDQGEGASGSFDLFREEGREKRGQY